MVSLAWLPVVCEKFLVINNLYTVLANLCIQCMLWFNFSNAVGVKLWTYSNFTQSVKGQLQ